ILFVVAFFVHVPDGVKWAGFILLDVVVQVALGLAAHGAAALGWFHGPNALLLFSLALYTARRSTTVVAATATASASAIS
ncbi:MAG TPA: hypothetical protein VGD55_08810, partial [Acidothermaceae bacterium]